MGLVFKNKTIEIRILSSTDEIGIAEVSQPLRLDKYRRESDESGLSDHL